jgi:hypothetical protein
MALLVNGSEPENSSCLVSSSELPVLWLGRRLAVEGVSDRADFLRGEARLGRTSAE